jgi:hypothetical protein
MNVGFQLSAGSTQSAAPARMAPLSTLSCLSRFHEAVVYIP